MDLIDLDYGYDNVFHHTAEDTLDKLSPKSLKIEGDVIDVEILESSPPGVFDDAVTKAVKQYRFDGDGSKYFVDQEVVFKLED